MARLFHWSIPLIHCGLFCFAVDFEMTKEEAGEVLENVTKTLKQNVRENTKIKVRLYRHEILSCVMTSFGILQYTSTTLCSTTFTVFTSNRIALFGIKIQTNGHKNILFMFINHHGLSPCFKNVLVWHVVLT